MKLPKISIVIPSYNKKEFIGNTLESIINQNYSNLEVIVQDGGSTDGTLEIIKQYAAKYPKIFKWESKKDNGQVDALEKGFKKATGDIYTYINADDCYSENALNTVGTYFVRHPETYWLTGRGDVIDIKGNQIWNLTSKYKNIFLKKNKFYFLLVLNYLMQPSVFLSKKAYLEHGPFKGTKKFVMEYDMWLKIGKKIMPKIIAKSLSFFRLQEGSLSMKLFRETLKEDYEIVKNYTNDPFILTLHELHNLGRVIMTYLTKVFK